MDDPFFAEDDGEFDDFYGNGSRNNRPSQTSMPRPSDSRMSAIRSAPSLAYPDTPASSVASFMSKSTDGGVLSVTTSTPVGNAPKRAKKHRRRRSQELFQGVEWEKDVDVSACFVCANDFSLLKRKHHCRHCGRVICSDCSSYWRFPGSHSKHRVCSYCNVELANGTGRHPTSRQSMAEAETPTQLPPTTRQSFAGGLPSNRQRVRESSGRKNDRDRATNQEPSGDLFQADDDAWFADPVDEENGRKDTGRPARVEERRSDAYIRPKVIEKRDSLFAVQFTSDDRSDDASDDDRDAFAMPKPTDRSKRTTAPATTRPSVVQSGYSSARSDDRLTLDDLMPSSASASYVSTVESYENGAVAARPSIKPAERTTFYSDDADKLIVDEAPGYYESVMREHQKTVSLTPGYAVATSMPQPIVVTPLSDNSSGTLIEAPEIAAAAATQQLEQTRRTSKSPEGKEGGRGFTGALKRFFGMSKSKPSDPPVTPAPRSNPPTHVDKPTPVPTNASTATATPPSAMSPTEHLAPLEMPRPAGFGAAETASDDHLDYDPRVLARDEDIVDVRYTMGDAERFRESHTTSTFRHTMAGYVVPSSQAPAESLVRASVVGGEADIDRAVKKERRRSSRNRRDTFGDLFDSPRKKSAESFAPSASTIASLPTRSWPRDDAYGARVTGPVGTDRFDRPRHDDPDDDLTKGLGLPSVKEDYRASNTTTSSWNAVSRYTTPPTEIAVYTAASHYDTPRESSFHEEYETEETVMMPAYGYQDSRDEPPRKTIMDDLRETTSGPSSRGGRPKDSVDDFFADFEKPNDYVFDTNSGTYVPANAIRAPQIYNDRGDRLSSQPNPAPRQVESRRDERPQASARRSEILQPVDEDQPDEIDGIIVDKISTLEGELEALKQLLRKRGLHQSANSPNHRGPSSANRKQSIFDSDDSEKEEKPRKKKSSSSKRRSSSTKEADSGRKDLRRPRKDSFASLFEDDAPEGPSKSVLGTRNYDALFQIGEGTAGGHSSEEETGERKLSKQKTKMRSQRENLSLSDSASDSSPGKKSTSRFSTAVKAFKSKRRNESDDEVETRVPGPSITSVPTPPKEQSKPTAKKKDTIDALFDSGSDHDMDSLFDSTNRPIASQSKHVEADTPRSEDEEAEIKHRKTNREASKSRSRAAVEATAESIPSYSVPVKESRNVSSDEEFSSTLKSLRNRRASKLPPAKAAPVQSVSADSSEEEESTTVLSTVPVRIDSASRLGLLFMPSVEDTVDSDHENTMSHADGESPAAGTETAHDTMLGAESDEDVRDDVSTMMERKVDAQVQNMELNAARQSMDEAPAKSESLFGDDRHTPAKSESLSGDDLPTDGGFDPLALLEEAPDNRRSSNQAAYTEAIVSQPVVEQLWEPEVSLGSAQNKAFRFRDSLLDTSSLDVLGQSPSLNLDDLLGGPSSGYGDSSDDDRSDDGDSGFSFEIKPKSRPTITPAETYAEVVPTIEVKNPSISTTFDEEETILLKARSPRAADGRSDDEGGMLNASGEQPAEQSTLGTSPRADDAELLGSDASSGQYQDDWQRLQEQEKERKKKLQLKQRQAQREKLKKQSSSGRALGKTGSSARSLELSASTSSTTSSEKSSRVSKGDSSEGKKKKKHRKKGEEGGDGDEDGKHRRKSDKRRHRERDQPTAESSGFDVDPSHKLDDNAPGPTGSQEGLTEL